MAEEPGQENRVAPSHEDKPYRGRLIGFAIAGAILGAILLVVFLWVWVHPTDPTEKKDFIQAVGVLLAALAALGGLYFTRTSTTDQLEQARKSQEQAQRLTEQGQITDRFTRAIDQLGATDDDRNPRLEIRLGGIYALERIAWDSPERDHSTVMAVLTAYVRENSRRSPKSSKPPEGNSESNSTSNPMKLPKRMKRRTSLLLQGHAILPLISKRSWMCSAAHRLASPRNTVLASICMEPTSKEPSSKKPGSKEPTSKKPGSKEPTSKKEPSSEEPTSEEPTSYKPTSKMPTSKEQPMSPRSS
jgi:hypothetical protein